MKTCMECEHSYILNFENKIVDCSLFRFGDYVTDPEGVASDCPCYKHDDVSFGKEKESNG